MHPCVVDEYNSLDHAFRLTTKPRVITVLSRGWWKVGRFIENCLKTALFRSPYFVTRWFMAFALFLFACAQAASAQMSSMDHNAQRTELNDAAVLIMAGRPNSTMMKIADDLAIALSDKDGSFRIVPVVGDGARGNIRDLILLRHIDVGITDLSALERMKRSMDLGQLLLRKVAHVVTLFPDKLQILARTSIKSVKDLDGKLVSVGLKDSGTELHAQAIFDALDIHAKQVSLAAPDSAEALVKGEIDAFVCFCVNSPDIYQRVMFNVDLHLLPIPFETKLQRDYLPATLIHEEFPSFIGKNEVIDTIAVTIALFTYNWEEDSPRYTPVAKFVERFFDNLSELQKPPRHPGWRSVQISADAAGWPRFAAAKEWQMAQRSDALQQMRSAFSEFLQKYRSDSFARIEMSDQIKLFEDFLVWRQSVQ